jgi:flagellar motor switch protein FliM
VSAVTGASAERPLTGESLQELFAARGGGVERLPLLREVMEKAASACTEEVRTLMRQPLSLAPAKAEARPDPGWAQQIRNQLTRADVTLTAILEERPGLLGEVLGLAVGQVIDLEATPQSRVRVECNGEALIWCDLGKSNGVYTLRVDSFVDREQEFMDDILAA